MSYRDNKSNLQIGSHRNYRAFSYKGTNKSQKYIDEHSSTSSDSQVGQNDNFNSGQVQQNIKHSSSNSSRISSDNETQNFIRAQFNKYAVKKQQNFKLFPNQSKKNDSSNTKNIFNQDTAKQQQNKKKKVYDTTYFEVQIQDNPKINNNQNKSLNKCQNTNTQQSNIQQQSKIPNSQHNLSQIHRYSQLQAIQSAIMRTLKQKQKQIVLIKKQVSCLNEQKLYNFKINQQLEKQLIKLKKRISQVETIRNNSLQNVNWKPQNVEQMKLAIQNQRLMDEFFRIEQEENKLKILKDQMHEQLIVMKQSLKIAFKTRRQYIKGLSINNSKTKQKYRCKENYSMGHNTQHIGKSNNDNKKIKYPKNFNCEKYQYQNNQIKNYNYQDTKQLCQLQQKQLLLKLLSDFNQLKSKVDESLTIKTKNKSKIKPNNQHQIKPKRRVVYQNS